MGKFRIPILLFVALLPFISLGTSEIQPWDEGLYAVRARTIIEHNAFWDQTEYSLGGLYSSTYPPLTVWAMAGSMALFGDNAFSIRLFSALCSFFSIFLFYSITKKLFNCDAAILASLLLSGTIVWNHYARQGMTDIPLLLFCLLAFWAIIGFINQEEGKKQLLLLGLFIIAFTASLMTKIIVSFLPISFVIFAFFLRLSLKKKILILTATFLSLAVASFWYLDMAIKYGKDFTNTLLVPHLFTSVEQNSPKIGFFYYFNQIVINNPFLILSFVFVILFIAKFKEHKASFTFLQFRAICFLIIWFLGLLALFSIAVTKMPHYILYFILPSIIITSLFIEFLYKEQIKGKNLALLTWLCIASFVWANYPEIRNEIKTFSMTNGFSLSIFLVVGFVLLLLFIIILLKKSTHQNIPLTLYRNIFLALILVLILKVFISNLFFPTGNSQGGYNTAQILINSGKNSFVYLYHRHNPADSINPQLAYYTGNWMLKRDSAKTYYPFALEENKISLAKLNELKLYSDDYIVYYLPENIELAKFTMNILSRDRPIISIEKEIKANNYILFGSIRRNYRASSKDGKVL